MLGFRCVLILLSILPAGSVIAQLSSLSLAGLCVKDTTVSRWTLQPAATDQWKGSPAMAVVGVGSREFWGDTAQDAGEKETPKGVRIVKSVGFGILTGGAGFGLGAGAAQVVAHPHGEDAGLAIVGGGLAGVPLLFPVGVHLGNESRGSLALDYLPVLATGATVLAIAPTSHDATPFIMLGIADIVVTVLIEHLVGN
jgi:hypothetical protein